jgi:hypothetical protein
MSEWDRAVKKYAEQERKELRLWGIATVFLILFLVALGFSLAAASGVEPAYCREMRALNPDWQFHYDDITGCRVLFRDFWIPVDDLPDVLRGGE